MVIYFDERKFHTPPHSTQLLIFLKIKQLFKTFKSSNLSTVKHYETMPGIVVIPKCTLMARRSWCQARTKEDSVAVNSLMFTFRGDLSGYLSYFHILGLGTSSSDLASPFLVQERLDGAICKYLQQCLSLECYFMCGSSPQSHNIKPLWFSAIRYVRKVTETELLLSHPLSSGHISYPTEENGSKQMCKGTVTHFTLFPHLRSLLLH